MSVGTTVTVQVHREDGTASVVAQRNSRARYHLADMSRAAEAALDKALYELAPNTVDP